MSFLMYFLLKYVNKVGRFVIISQKMLLFRKNITNFDDRFSRCNKIRTQNQQKANSFALESQEYKSIINNQNNYEKNPFFNFSPLLGLCH